MNEYKLISKFNNIERDYKKLKTEHELLKKRMRNLEDSYTFVMQLIRDVETPQIICPDNPWIGIVDDD
jgi:hypothetical protein